MQELPGHRGSDGQAEGKRARWKEADGSTEGARASTRDRSQWSSQASSEEIQFVDELGGQLSPRISEGNEAEQDSSVWDADVNDLISEADALLDEALCSEEFGPAEDLDALFPLGESPGRGGGGAAAPQESPLARGPARGGAASGAEGQACRQHECRSPSLQEVIEVAQSEYDMLKGLSDGSERKAAAPGGDPAVLGRTAWYRGEGHHHHGALAASAGHVAGAAGAAAPRAAPAGHHAAGQAAPGRVAAPLRRGAFPRCGSFSSLSDHGGSQRSAAASVAAHMGDRPAEEDPPGDEGEDSDGQSLDMMVSISER